MEQHFFIIIHIPYFSLIATSIVKEKRRVLDRSVRLLQPEERKNMIKYFKLASVFTLVFHSSPLKIANKIYCKFFSLNISVFFLYHSPPPPSGLFFLLRCKQVQAGRSPKSRPGFRLNDGSRLKSRFKAAENGSTSPTA